MSLMKVRAESKGLELRVKFEGEIPETILTGSGQLRQILINLIGNAMKFTESGWVELVVRLTRAAGAEPRLEFVVSDTGIGLTEKQMSEVFEPFSQADSSTTRRFGGTGLGLAISKRLAEKLGGDIKVMSDIGRGSAFTLSIATGSLDGVEMLDNPSEAAGLEEETRKPLGDVNARLDCRVLLVEDGPDNQRIISFFLNQAGAEVALAENGQVAVDVFRATRKKEEPFDAIVMDMQMPVMDGYEASRRLRAEGYDGPIIALTAHAMVGDREKCLEAGCNDYMAKPVDRGVLLSLVSHWTEVKPLASPKK
jgi:CheY-like chemotaxis protein